ncbi:DUF4955 domain-containing protein [Flavivirga algicola]|uniref:DUF4955 domain-containing protein n=1 Tax=Flavivirga algicola TaxID=2729136 RepID=A0ABX1S1S7_9FLAO|nr:DUF4955 domain-containing protein [Flavivirga algicola]NMH88384.1 DUF4955 domain-containing protein [Flavivirga algicola]
MRLRLSILILVVSCSIWNCKSQETTLWENFKQAKKDHSEPTLPDFSYAGYKHSEVEIPHVDYKIFDVTNYGAKPNDEVSDKNAIKKAIKAATKNGNGIIYFPKGKYDINTSDDDQSIIAIASSNIVFRGEDQKNTILFFNQDLPPANPKKLWTCPYAIQAKSLRENSFLSKVISNSRRESHKIKLSDASKIKKGDWVILKVLNNDKELVHYDLGGLEPEKGWTSILEKGVRVNEYHQIASVNGDTIETVAPIHYDIKARHNWEVHSFAHIDHVGFENLTFEGNWIKKFVHHRSAQDDGGWSILKITRAVNSWIRNCTFKNISNAASFSQSANSTALSITIEGNFGHSSVHASRSTNILIANCTDKSGMHHAFGVDGFTSGTVIWRSNYPAHTSFESHASQPRYTLFDKVEGGFFQGRAGGARFNLPNHGRYLVLWNFNEIDKSEENFRFVATDTWFWRISPPIIVGFHGAGTTFKKDEVQILESLGAPVAPESLFEAQLELRLGSLPKWIMNIKKK